jgi:VWFA-related protein
VAIPPGYTIVAYETSTTCPHGAYILKRDESQTIFSPAAANSSKPAPQKTATGSRPRRVGESQANDIVQPFGEAEVQASAPQLGGNTNNTGASGPPKLGSMPTFSPVSAPAKESSGTSLDEKKEDDEVGPGDVVRIDTSLVSVPVSVLDRNGRFIGNLTREDFKVYEDGVEQKVAFFEPTEKPFTVALLLDTSGSTVFHLTDIKEAAITFAKQLRPQDRVLVITFDERVMLLTEATSDQRVITEVIEQNANTGHSTRLYDAVDLVINQRLNQINGRKAIVLFTDGVDTASYGATYQSTLRQAEELDALIYPIQYDTTDFMNASQGNVTIISRSGTWPFPGRSQSRVYNLPNQQRGSTEADYKLADKYLHQLADKTGARLFKANDPAQLAVAFSKIAEELRCQYSLGYYPQTTSDAGERRAIKVKVAKSDLAVRARESYVKKGGAPTQ